MSWAKINGPNFDLWLITKNQNKDILRETQISQFYRYAKILQLLDAG
jgi:hypothetical protein